MPYHTIDPQDQALSLLIQSDCLSRVQSKNCSFHASDVLWSREAQAEAQAVSRQKSCSACDLWLLSWRFMLRNARFVFLGLLNWYQSKLIIICQIPVGQFMYITMNSPLLTSWRRKKVRANVNKTICAHNLYNIFLSMAGGGGGKDYVNHLEFPLHSLQSVPLWKAKRLVVREKSPLSQMYLNGKVFLKGYQLCN